jgi:hypothetical protein
MGYPTKRRLSAKERVRAVAKIGSPSTATLLPPNSTGPPIEPIAPAHDLLVGAAAIAEFLFGSADQRRKVYWWIARGDLPVFKFGSTVCARKSTLMRDMTQREAREAELSVQA